jgi:hypothetical protein
LTAKARAASGPEVHFALARRRLDIQATLALLHCAAIISSPLLSFLRSEILRRISRDCSVSASIDGCQGGDD